MHPRVGLCQGIACLYVACLYVCVKVSRACMSRACMFVSRYRVLVFIRTHCTYCTCTSRLGSGACVCASVACMSRLHGRDCMSLCLSLGTRLTHTQTSRVSRCKPHAHHKTLLLFSSIRPHTRHAHTHIFPPSFPPSASLCHTHTLSLSVSLSVSVCLCLTAE